PARAWAPARPPAAQREPRALLPAAPPPTPLSPLSLHDALPISGAPALQAAAARGKHDFVGPAFLEQQPGGAARGVAARLRLAARSEEHTSELQSRENLVCRLLLEKKNASDPSEAETQPSGQPGR